jgi:hypothetical protein
MTAIQKLESLEILAEQENKSVNELINTGIELVLAGHDKCPGLK